MNETYFSTTYSYFGLETPPLSGDYSPERYAKMLMRNVPQKQGVSYAVNTVPFDSLKMKDRQV